MKAMDTIRKIERTVSKLSRMTLPYDYGGARQNGHIIEPVDGKPWTDCSGCVCYTLDKNGIKLKNAAGTTWTLAEEGQPGTSRLLTLYIKNNPVGHDEHVIVRGRKRPRPWHLGIPRYRFWECGGSDNPKPSDGPAWFIPGRGMGLSWKLRVSEFYIRRNFDAQLKNG